MTTNDTDPFSRRFGYSPTAKPIIVREDAPPDLRFAVAELAREQKLSPHEQRGIVCRVLLTAPNSNNWSAYPNVWDEVRELLESCDWYKIYDIIEAYYDALVDEFMPDERAEKFEKGINDFFRDRGIGWQLQSGKIVVRGSEAFSAVTSTAAEELAKHKRPIAANELHEAIIDLSRRPKPDVTGAIQHAMAAVECVAREISDPI
jgi:hypothetical protein